MVARMLDRISTRRLARDGRILMTRHVAGYHRLGPMRRQYMRETGGFIGGKRCPALPARRGGLFADVLIADGFKVTRDDVIRLRAACRRVRDIRRRFEILARYKITRCLRGGNSACPVAMAVDPRSLLETRKLIFFSRSRMLSNTNNGLRFMRP